MAKAVKKTPAASATSTFENPENDLLLPRPGTSYKVTFSEPPALKDPFTRAIMKMLQEMNNELETETLKSAKLQQKLARIQGATGSKTPGSLRRLPSPGSSRRSTGSSEGGSIRFSRSPSSTRRLPVPPGESEGHGRLDPSSALSLSRETSRSKLHTVRANSKNQKDNDVALNQSIASGRPRILPF